MFLKFDLEYLIYQKILLGKREIYTYGYTNQRKVYLNPKCRGRTAMKDRAISSVTFFFAS